MNVASADATPRSTARRLSPWVVLVTLLGAMVIAWFAARSAVQRMYGGSQPQLTGLLLPQTGDGETQMALDRIVALNGVTDPISRSLYRDALRRSPLMSEPFILAGLDASSTGDVARARRMMEEARRRNPRATIARYWLLDDYLRNGNYAGALDEVAPLVALKPDAGDAVIALATALIGVPDARPALIAKLRTNPFWRGRFFTQASSSPSLVGLIPALLTAAPYRPGQPASPQEQQKVTEAAIRRGQYREAYRLWRELLPQDYAARQAAGVYDGNFVGWPGSPPFNWRLRSDRAGSVRRVEADDLPQRSALDIGYHADGRVMLAEQLVMLPSGPQRLHFTLRRTSSGDAGDAGIGARVDCASPRKPLGRASFNELPATAAERTLDFTVPPTCAAVRLAFRAEPGLVTGGLEVQVTGVRIDPRR